MSIQRTVLSALIIVLLSAAARAEGVVVKFASLAPRGSAWDLSIRETDEKWRAASGGKVRLRIFSGTMGDESDIMRRVRIGQLDAASVTAATLSTIHPALNAMNIPMAFASNEELDYVWRRMAGGLEKALADKGYVVLAWGTAGWVYFYTREPVSRPADLKKLKLFIWTAGDVTTVEGMWKRMGYQPVPLSAVDILPGLQTGMIAAFQSPPIMALANQWFPFAGWVADVKWAPVLGATVIAKRTWRRIPVDLRDTLMSITRETGKRMVGVIRRLEESATQAMIKRGLKVVPVPPDAVREWRAEARAVYPTIRGRMIPAAYFDEAIRLRDEYRGAAGRQSDVRR